MLCYESSPWCAPLLKTRALPDTDFAGFLIDSELLPYTNDFSLPTFARSPTNQRNRTLGSMRLIVISGLSGSGKSIALNVLEDSGYYCVDNLPAKLLIGLTQFLAQEDQQRVAVSIDVRSGASLSDLPGYLLQLRGHGIDLHLVFLDAKTDTLVKRFSETRRRHPLAHEERTLPECIERERELLADIGD